MMWLPHLPHPASPAQAFPYPRQAMARCFSSPSYSAAKILHIEPATLRTPRFLPRLTDWGDLTHGQRKVPRAQGSGLNNILPRHHFPTWSPDVQLEYSASADMPTAESGAYPCSSNVKMFPLFCCSRSQGSVKKKKNQEILIAYLRYCSS